MDVIILNRISTDNKDQDPKSNLIVTNDFSKRNNLNPILTLIDEGISGSVPYYDRPEASKIDLYVKRYNELNKPLGIVVFSIDRFTREHPVKGLNHIYNLKEKGCKIFSATEPIFNEETEFSLPMQFNILWFGWYFLKQHSKKVKAGIEKRRKEGKFVGRALLKRTTGKGKNIKYIYYTKKELKNIHELIKKYSKKRSYRQTKLIMFEKYNVNISIGYISKVMNEK